MSATAPEPKPQPNDNPAIWDLVLRDVPHLGDVTSEPIIALCADMGARDAMGRAKYGMPLTAGNGRNPWTDAYQEALDGCAYSRQMIEEAAPMEMDEAWEVYRTFFELALRLKTAAIRREGWAP
jgi:hypothetical protein